MSGIVSRALWAALLIAALTAPAVRGSVKTLAADGRSLVVTTTDPGGKTSEATIALSDGARTTPESRRPHHASAGEGMGMVCSRTISHR